MKIFEFQQLASRTLAMNENDLLLNIHMLFGVTTEIGELAEIYDKHIEQVTKTDHVAIQEELGDIFWYLCNFCNINSISSQTIIDAIQEKNDLVYSTSIFFLKLYNKVGKLIDIYKKFIAYNKSIDDKLLFDRLVDIFRILLSFCKTNDYNIYSIFEANTAKLKKRYPTNFDENLAIYKNTEEERMTLELFLDN